MIDQITTIDWDGWISLAQHVGDGTSIGEISKAAVKKETDFWNFWYQSIRSFKSTTLSMAGVAAQPPIASMSTRSSPVVNGNGSANLDYINGHGALPESPASAAPPSAATSKKAKAASNQKPQDDQKKTEKLLAARINELEQNTKGDKEQEAEIGMSIHTLSAQARQVRLARALALYSVEKLRAAPTFSFSFPF